MKAVLYKFVENKGIDSHDHTHWEEPGVKAINTPIHSNSSLLIVMAINSTVSSGNFYHTVGATATMLGI